MMQLRRYIINIEGHTLEMFYYISPGILNRWEFFYDESVFRNPYIIYGAGVCGQALYHWLNRKGLTENLVAWVDKDPVRVQAQCDWEILKPDEGLKEDFTFIVLGIKEEISANSIILSLMNKYRIPNEKLVWKKPKENLYLSEVLF